MNGSISAPFIKYPIGTSLIMVGILFVGLDRVSQPAGRAAAAGRLPDHPGDGDAARRQPGHHGLVGGPAAGASVRADPRRHADDVVERARHHDRGGAVRPRSQHRCGGQRHPGGHQCRERAAAAGPAVAADLSQGEPGRLADPAAVGDLRHPAADGRRRQRRHQARPADQPDQRRRPGQHRRRAEAGHPHPARSGQAGRQEPVAGGRAHAARHHHGQHAQGQHRRRGAQLHHLRQRPADRGRQVERCHHRLSQRRAAAHPRHRPGRLGSRGRQEGRLGIRQARRVPDRLQAAGRQRHRDGRPHQGGAAAAAGGDAADAQGRDPERPDADHPCLGGGRATHACSSPSRWWWA